MDRSALPTDMFDVILDHADCPTINGLARTCHALAQIVYGRAIELADKHVIREGICHKLPNGTKHMTSQYWVGDNMFAITYDRGTPTHWSVKYKDRGALWGCRDSPYIAECTYPCDISSIVDCKVCADFTVGWICASMTDDVSYIVGKMRIIEVLSRHARPPRPVGFMVDGRMNGAVINAWMAEVIARIVATNALSEASFTTPIPRVMVVGHEIFDAMSQFSAVNARRS